MSEHTPGPWSRESIYYAMALLGRANPEQLGILVDNAFAHAEKIPGMKDIDLLASAPELLAALEEIVNNATKYPTAQLCEAASPAAIRAIAKAKAPARGAEGPGGPPAEGREVERITATDVRHDFDNPSEILIPGLDKMSDEILKPMLDVVKKELNDEQA